MIKEQGRTLLKHPALFFQDESVRVLEEVYFLTYFLTLASNPRICLPTFIALGGS